MASLWLITYAVSVHSALLPGLLGLLGKNLPYLLWPAVILLFALVQPPPPTVDRRKYVRDSWQYRWRTDDRYRILASFH